ncbi:hypothetical protein F5148DRAFT_275666 [Russula earlei]|uniref:Uncharacterized protein n=1 Tax=Russula earlei TaxID=71964 RepID=A0ACC0U4D4_9AGAM|nr:hypothetical protein F5148DRAFT_275666 [Russula earlei]
MASSPSSWPSPWRLLSYLISVHRTRSQCLPRWPSERKKQSSPYPLLPSNPLYYVRRTDDFVPRGHGAGAFTTLRTLLKRTPQRLPRPAFQNLRKQERSQKPATATRMTAITNRLCRGQSYV